MTNEMQLVTIRRRRNGPPLPGFAQPPPMFGSEAVIPYGAAGLDEPRGRVDRPATPELPSEKSADGSRDVYELSMADPIALAGSLAHHLVDDDHLWIAVEDGKVIVADDDEHEMMLALIDRHPPSVVALRLETLRGLDGPAARRETAKFLGRLAAAGFVQGITGYHTVKKIRPHAFARFHLTQRCQLECVHCYTDSGPHLPKDGELSTERWIRLVDDFADNGGSKILFTGGEALVHRGCIDIMRRAHERGLEVTLFSNGILVPKHLDELREVADIVQISVDGPTAATHDAIRGKQSFVKAIRAIRLLLDAGIETRVSTTIMLNNWDAIKDELPGFIAQFEDTNLSFRISYGAMAHGRGKDLDHTLDYESVRRFVDGLLSRVRTTENRDGGPNAIQKLSGCGYAEQLVVAPDGLVYPCHLLSGALGHVDQLPLPEITKYLERTAEAFSVNHRVGCRTCDLRNLCGGSCRVEDEKVTGSRLVTTCNPEEKLRKKRFLARRYRAVAADG